MICSIVLIHTIFNNSKGAWTNTGTGCLWPRDLLLSDLPGAKIWCFDYSSVFQGAHPIAAIANNFIEDFMREEIVYESLKLVNKH